MTDIRLDPDALPVIDIVALAQEGALLRAEHDTPPDGIPAFVTAAGWRMLCARYAGDDPHGLLTHLGKAVHRLLAHAAQSHAAEHRAGHAAPASFSCPSDLFEDNGTLHIAFLRDTNHPVICTLIGTKDHIRDLMETPFRDD